MAEASPTPRPALGGHCALYTPLPLCHLHRNPQLQNKGWRDQAASWEWCLVKGHPSFWFLLSLKWKLPHPFLSPASQRPPPSQHPLPPAQPITWTLPALISSPFPLDWRRKWLRMMLWEISVTHETQKGEGLCYFSIPASVHTSLLDLSQIKVAITLGVEPSNVF